MVDEASAGVYKAYGTDKSGRRVEVTGTDPNALLDECKKYAERIPHRDNKDEGG